MVTIGGIDYEFKALTVRQVREAQKHEDVSDIEVAALVAATGAPLEAVTEWFDTAPAGVVFKATREMWEVANATDDARFPGGTGPDVGVERAGV